MLQLQNEIDQLQNGARDPHEEDVSLQLFFHPVINFKERERED